MLDPHPLWIEAIRNVLEKSDIAVVGATTSAEEATTLLAEHRPELFVADVADTGSNNGLSVVRRARECSPDMKIVVLSASSKPEDVRSALAAGARAYVLKTASPDDVAFAVRHAFSPSAYFAGSHGELPAAPQPSADISTLTRREVEILRLVAEGQSNGQVARKLWVTEQTVKFHLSNIYRKLNVANRTEASRWAQTQGLLRQRGDS